MAVLLFVISTGPTLYQKVGAIIQKRRLEVREQRLAQKHWEELRSLLIELHEITDTGKADVLSIIAEFAGYIVPYKQGYYYPHDAKYALSIITDILLPILDSEIKNKRAFISSVQLLGHLMRFWHDMSMRMTNNLIKDLETSQYKLNSYQKQMYNTVRKRHDDVMDKYVEFAKTVNSVFGDANVWRLYHEPLPDL